jgi:hypothetical protein
MGRNCVKSASFIFFIAAFVLLNTKSVRASEPGQDVNISESSANRDDMGQEAEMMIDVNPLNPNHMVIACHGTIEDPEGDGWEDDYPEIINLFFTIDGGDSWTRMSIGSAQDGVNIDLTPSDTTDDNPEDARADPVISFDENGTLYLGYIIVPDYNTDLTVWRIMVARGIYNELLQTYVFDYFVGLENGNVDKLMLATGPDPENPSTQVVYVTWINVDTGARVAHSTDSGYHWSTPRTFDYDTSDKFIDPAVGPDGTLYIAWLSNSDATIRMATSSDRGDSSDTMDVVTDISMEVKIPTSAAPQRGIHIGTVLDVDRSGGPHNGRVYLVYCDYDFPAGETADNSDIYFQYYDPTLPTPAWSSPVQINSYEGSGDDDKSQFLPWLDVNQETGTVAVGWYDAHDDKFNKNVHLYINYSLDGGETFQDTDFRLSDTPSDETGTFGIDTPYTWHRDYLEYIGVVAYGTRGDEAIRAVWAGKPSVRRNTTPTGLRSGYLYGLHFGE